MRIHPFNMNVISKVQATDNKIKRATACNETFAKPRNKNRITSENS